jgi:hypothetical protein
MIARSVVLVLLVSIPATLLCCDGPQQPSGWHSCWCTDPVGNKTFVMQDGPCENQPTGSGMTCVPLQGGTGGAGGGGGSADGGR